MFVGRAGRTTGATLFDSLNSIPTRFQAPEGADPEAAKNAREVAIREQAEAFIQTWREDLSEEQIAKIRATEKVWELESSTSLLARTEFEVLESFVGDLPQRVAVGSGMGTCGLTFEPGRDYLVVAGRDENGVLGTSMCSGTRALEGENHDLAALRAWRRGDELPRVVYGSVFDSTQRLEPRRPSSFTVKLDGAGHTLRARANPDRYSSFFEFRDLPQDVYRLELDEPGWVMAFTEPNANEIDLKTNHCAVVQIYVRQEQGGIRGKLRPMAGATLGSPIVEAILVGEDLRTLGASKVHEDGSFEISQLEPGDYRVALNVNSPPTSLNQRRMAGWPGHNNPYPPVFYPGVADATEAPTFRVERGRTTDVGDWSLPAPLRELRKRVRVVLPNGSPATDARLMLRRRLPHLVADVARFGPSSPDGVLDLILFEGLDVMVEVVAQVDGRPYRAEAVLQPNADETVLHLNQSEWRAMDHIFFDKAAWGVSKNE